MRLNVTSEIGKLRRVLVHLPGREIDDMIPPMMGQLLFDDILYGQVAREEHRRFQQLIRFVAEDVYEMQDLLEETLEDDEIRRIVIRDFTKRNRCSRKVGATLKELAPAALAEGLLGGIPDEREQSGALPRFAPFPVPHFFFRSEEHTSELQSHSFISY